MTDGGKKPDIELKNVGKPKSDQLFGLGDIE
jgi:hypothetical protein